MSSNMSPTYPSLRSHWGLWVTLLLCLTGCTSSRQRAPETPHRPAGAESHRAASAAYLGAQNTHSLAESYLPFYLEEAGAKGAHLSDSERQKLTDSLIATLESEEVKRDLIELYLVSFTEQELEELTAFYKTPAGNKFLEKAPSLTNAAARIVVGAFAEQQAARAAEETPASEDEALHSNRRSPRLDENGVPLAPPDVAAAPPGSPCTDSGVCYRILREGPEDAPRPTAQSRIVVHYTGWTKDGARFDSSIARGQPVSFRLNQVIRGWTDALKEIREGSVVRLWIPAELAYGDSPTRPDAPAGQLTFDVHLIQVEDHHQ